MEYENDIFTTGLPVHVYDDGPQRCEGEVGECLAEVTASVAHPAHLAPGHEEAGRKDQGQGQPCTEVFALEGEEEGREDVGGRVHHVQEQRGQDDPNHEALGAAPAGATSEGHVVVVFRRGAVSRKVGGKKLNKNVL